MSDECFAPRNRRKYGVTVRESWSLPEPLIPSLRETLVSNITWMGHWTMARALDELDPFQRNAHIELRTIAHCPAVWLPKDCLRR